MGVKQDLRGKSQSHFLLGKTQSGSKKAGETVESRALRPRPGFFGFRTKVSSAPEMVSLSDGSKVPEHSVSPPLLITLSSKKLLFASKLSRPWH